MLTLKKAEDLQALIARSDILLLQFGTEACNPCRAIKEKIDDWTRDYDQVETRYIPLEDFPGLCAEYGIFSAPTILLVVRGKVTIRESGYFSLDQVLGRTERYMEFLQ